jgi:hypothetical protein
VKRWGSSVLLSLSALTLILVAVLLGLISWLALQTLVWSPNNGLVISPAISTVGLYTPSHNLSFIQLATLLPSETAILQLRLDQLPAWTSMGCYKR